METETASRKLTKKGKKALAFRTNAGNKGKPKGRKVTGDLFQMAVPQMDDLDDKGGHANAEEGEKKGKKAKKRKRDETDANADADTATAAEGGAAKADSEEPKKKKRQLGKKPSQRNRDAAAAKASKLLLFIGNLPYKVTIEDIKTHFTCGEVPEVRLLTPRPRADAAGATPTTNNSKGCAFIEFTSPFALQSALRLHESELNGRKINVELTAGGGGNSEARKKKLQDKRVTMQKERERVALNRKKKEIEAGKLNPDGSRLWGQPNPSATDATAGVEGESAGAASSSVQHGAGSTALNGAEKKVKKVRDRRLVKDGPAEARSKPVKAPKALMGANSTKLGSF